MEDDSGDRNLSWDPEYAKDMSFPSADTGKHEPKCHNQKRRLLQPCLPGLSNVPLSQNCIPLGATEGMSQFWANLCKSVRLLTPPSDLDMLPSSKCSKASFSTQHLSWTKKWSSFQKHQKKDTGILARILEDSLLLQAATVNQDNSRQPVSTRRNVYPSRTQGTTSEPWKIQTLCQQALAPSFGSRHLLGIFAIFQSMLWCRVGYRKSHPFWNI